MLNRKISYFLIVVLLFIGILLRVSIVTDHLKHALVKDPNREIPSGNVIVAPADGTIVYIKKIIEGKIPPIVKESVNISINEFLKFEPQKTIQNGYLIGIYMNTQGIHINRAPMSGKLMRHHIFNGPHMDMTEFEINVIFNQLIPGLISLKKIFGLAPFDYHLAESYILNSARDIFHFEDKHHQQYFVIRVADYYVGKLLTWIKAGELVNTGDKIGYITWGSQTDLLIESDRDLSLEISVGDYVYAGSSIFLRQ